jgi:hypothetical protein
MAGADKTPATIGRAELIALPEFAFSSVPARIDTGAKTSALWVSSIRMEEGRLCVVLFGESSPFYTGKELRFDEYDTTVVASSTGEAQERYKVRVLVQLAGRKIRAWFTLADRSTQAYPVLIGRNVLLGKFVVDVKQGTIAKDAEKQRTAALDAARQRTDASNAAIEQSKNEEQA